MTSFVSDDTACKTDVYLSMEINASGKSARLPQLTKSKATLDKRSNPDIYPYEHGSQAKKKPRFRKRFSAFADYTSTHGLPHIKRVRTKWHKLMWVIFLMSATGGLLYQIISVTGKYLGNPYTVLVDVKFERSIKFPAVTICNANALRKSKLDDLAGLNEFESFLRSWIDFDSSWNRSLLQREAHLNVTEQTPLDNTYPSFDSVDDFWDQNIEYEDYGNANVLVEKIQKLDNGMKENIGHQLESMLLKCRFHDKRCTPRDFEEVYNAKYGNCYTLNGGTEAKENASRPGPAYGLTLELFLEVDEYIHEITDSVGVVVVLHDQKHVPLPDEEGFLVPPGYETRLGVTRFEVERLGDPYYTCWSSSTSNEKNIYSHEFTQSYSYTICLRSCYQHALMNACGCGDPDYPLNHPLLQSGFLKPCMSNNRTERMCKNNVYSTYEHGKLPCHCEQACNEIHFFTNPSSSLWPIPTLAAQIHLLNEYRQQGHPRLLQTIANSVDHDQQVTAFRDNVARILIYYEDLNYEKLYQKSSYNINDLISDVGGNMGMFVGMSLLTLAEYWELAGYILYTVYTKYLWRKEKKAVHKS